MASVSSQHHGNIIHSATLKGHQDAVLCLDFLDYSSSAPFAGSLLSGSQDRTARLWDLRTASGWTDNKSPSRAALCLHGLPEAVSSVAFGRTNLGLDGRGSTNPHPSATSTPTTTGKQDDEKHLPPEVTTISIHIHRDYAVFLSAGCAVYEYDLRQVRKEVMVIPFQVSTAPSSPQPAWMDWTLTLAATDEINHLLFRPGAFLTAPPVAGRPSSSTDVAPASDLIDRYMLASADDAGLVRILQRDARGHAVRTYAHGGHLQQHEPDVAPNLPSMVTCLAWRGPLETAHQRRSRGHLPSSLSPPITWGLLASGGTNCQVCLWDLDAHDHHDNHEHDDDDDDAKATKKTGALGSSYTFPTSSQLAGPLYNPPMVNSLAWSPSGRLLAAALGDGSLGLLEVSSSGLLPVARLDEAHSGPVASVLFPAWTPPSSGSGRPEGPRPSDRLLISAGNDGAIALWDLGSWLCPADPDLEAYHTPPAWLFSPSSTSSSSTSNNNNNKKKKNKNSSSSPQQRSAAEDENGDQESPRAMCAWPLGAKPNWLVATPNSCALGETILVADTSPTITAYTLPRS